MRWVFALALVGAAPAARADEADDLLARKLVSAKVTVPPR